MLFPKRQQILGAFTGNAQPGGTIVFSISRDFYLDSILLRVPVTVVTSAETPTALPLGILGLIQNVTLAISDGQSNRNQTNASGHALVRHAAKVVSGLDANTLMALAPSNPLNSASGATLTFDMTVPLFFKDPQLSDPVGSAFMLPLPRYNTNPTLTVTLGTSASIASNDITSVTFGNPYLVLNKRDTGNIAFPVWDHEFVENVQVFGSTGANQLYEFQVPGSYSNIGMFMQASAGTPEDITGGPFYLQYLSNSLRQFNAVDTKVEEQYSQGNDGFYPAKVPSVSQPNILLDYFPGFYDLDFLHDGYGMETGELGSVINVNQLAGSGSKLQMLCNIATAGQISFTWRRIFGDLSPLKLSTQIASY